MRVHSILLVSLLLTCTLLAANECYTVDNVTEAAAVAAGGKKQVMVVLLKRDDLPKGDFQRATAFCRDKGVAMAVSSPDSELVHTFLTRELAATGKRRAKGVTIVVVGPKTQDPRLRPLMESYGVHFIYAECVEREKKG